MIGDIKGYALIKKSTSTGKSPLPISEFEGKIVRVLDWAVDDSGILCLNSKATGLATFDNKDIEKKFKCEVLNDIILPTGLNFIQKAAYITKVMNRKGGYAKILKDMVIAASLIRGKFNDAVLWQKQ